jgi:omega-6 fatty acid desaturase (delta-12 desaturase)
MGGVEGPREELAEELAGDQKRAGPFYSNLISDHQIFIDPVSDGQAPGGQAREEETPDAETPDQGIPEERISQKWRAILGPYGGADLRRSLTQILTSVVPLFIFWYAAYRALSVGYWLTLILAVPTAGFVMRLFLIQHDCGHGSFFKSQKVADFVGFWLGVATLTPYRYWRKTHAYHHAHSGDLGFRGLGDVDTITVSEYHEKTFLGRLRYRLYRHPFVLLGLGGFFVFALKHRFPWDIPRRWKREWASVWKTNAALAAILVLAGLTIGLKAAMLVHLPVLIVTGTVGVWLFYVQHQFEDTYWKEHTDWSYFEAGLEGSSYLVLPKPLQWVTASIGIHHIHHLSARIPNYRLQQCLDENPQLQHVTRITIWDGLKTLRLALWDEDSRRLISFREARRLASTV